MFHFWGAWDEYRRAINTFPMRIKAATTKATLLNAELMKKTWVDGIKGNMFGLAPNKDITLVSKSGSTPLKDKNFLIKAIELHPIAQDIIFVGIRNGEKNNRGYDLVMVATTLEYGTQKEIRPKGGKTFLTIPLTKAAKNYASANDFAGLRFYKVGEGNDILDYLFTKGNAFLVDDSNVAHYLLARKVKKIPPRPAMRETLALITNMCLDNWGKAVSNTIWGRV